MLKHVYRAIVVVAVFIVAVYLYSQGIEMISVDYEKTIEIGGSTFPILHVKSSGMEMNRLYGYSGNLSPNAVRESITPLGTDKTLDVYIKEYVDEIQKIQYEVRHIETNELLESGSISALEETEEGKALNITLEAELNTSTEYALKFTAITKGSKKIHYYTRIKHYVDDSYLKEKYDFVLNFHKDTFIKDQNKQKTGISTYIEPNAGVDNSSLAKTSMYSSYDLITWAEVKPKIVSDVIPTIKEFNIETGCFQLSYFIEIENRLGKHRYFVQEFYRVRYEVNRIRLLYFERTMESTFQEGMLSPEGREIKLGVTSDTERDVVTNVGDTRVCFVKDHALYYYDIMKSSFMQVYSFYTEEQEVDYKLYPEHDVQVIKMDEEGNIYFVVYGYITRGDYEGKVAILLYKFHVAENSIEELAYIPLLTTYQKIKEDFNEHCYINTKDNFYFFINNKLLIYNTVAKNLTVLADGVSEDDFLVLKEKNCFVWTDSKEGVISKNLHILNLDSGKTIDITPKEGEGVQLYGTINDNVVYGFVKESEVVKTTDGAIIVPANQIEIADENGKVETTYEYKKKGYYFTDVSIGEDIITIERSKKVKKGNSITYKKIDEDQLRKNLHDEAKVIRMASKTSEDILTEWYITLPSIKEENWDVKASITKRFVITKDTSLHLENEEREKYYVYAYGRVTDSSESPSDAIQVADEKMGVVISSKNQLVWERGGKFYKNSIAGVEKTKASGKLDSAKACLYMLLKVNHIPVKTSDVMKKKTSMIDILKEYLDQPVSLAGCNLDEVLYFVSGGKPVIAMTDNKEAVLIIGYDKYSITIINPKTGLEETWYLTNANKTFEGAGNVYVSYIN